MMARAVHPIEVESYAILRRRVDTTALPALTRAVVERVVHSSADLDYVHELVCSEPDLLRAVAALRAGAPVVADVEMVAAGITTHPVICRLRDPRTQELARRVGITRSAAGVRIAFQDVGPGAVWVIGNAPTALYELLELDAEPALVIGLPVGFVGAADSKRALRESGLPAISNTSDKGGSAVAAGALNALLYFPSSESAAIE